MLIDDIKIKISAGSGGRGAVAFNKDLMSLGPAGGSGGKGGSIYFEGVSDLNALGQFRYKKDIKAKDGANGNKQFRDGPDGNEARTGRAAHVGRLGGNLQEPPPAERGAGRRAQKAPSQRVHHVRLGHSFQF